MRKNAGKKWLWNKSTSVSSISFQEWSKNDFLIRNWLVLCFFLLFIKPNLYHGGQYYLY